jgi:threonine/homoserine/homoserine lactone efflux protein
MLGPPRERRMDELVGLVGFSFVSSVTPGPNNILLWASGAEFGLRRTIPHVVGTALGIGSLALAVAAGLGIVITTIPEIAFAMKAIGSVYLLYLAYQIAGAHALERGTIARPLGLVQAATFQAINPKAWIFALGAVTTFRPSELAIIPGSILVAITMMLVVIPTAALWAGGGEALSRFVSGERARRIVSLVLAAIVVATIVFVWI